jgi:hypothetical protein
MELPLRIHVAYAVPPKSRKNDSWHDGFTAAMGIIGDRHDVRLVNVHPDADDADRKCLPHCDFLLVKSNWGDVAYQQSERLLRSAKGTPPLGLMISGVTRPPLLYWRRSGFDVLWYETEWYAGQVRRHPLAIHAFGTDTEIMRPGVQTERDIDWLSVGRLIADKRHERLCHLDGERVVATDFSNADPRIRASLAAAGVQLFDYLDAEDLAVLYRRAKNVLVNCTVHGGGERAVLEARACGANVVVAADNPKLTGLATGPLYDHHYYAAQLSRGIALAVAPRPGGAEADGRRITPGRPRRRPARERR